MSCVSGAIFGDAFEDLQLDVEIRLSYAARSAATASYYFADNVGGGRDDGLRRIAHAVEHGKHCPPAIRRRH